MAKHAEDQLKIRRELINTHFEGYKLSLDSLPIYIKQLENGVATVELTEEQFSYHHVKLFGVHNHLVLDLWNTSDVYIVDTDWNIVKATACNPASCQFFRIVTSKLQDKGQQDTSIEYGTACFTIPDAGNQQHAPGRYNTCLHFVSADLCIIGDGAGSLHIIHTGNRAEGNQNWKCLLSVPVPVESCPCVLLDAVETAGDTTHQLHCLVVHVVDSSPEEKDKYRSQFLTVLTWITFTSADTNAWVLHRTRRLVSRKPFHHASLGREGRSITIAGEAEFHFTYDSDIPIVSTKGNEGDTNESRPPDYTWHQTKEDVTVQFTVPTGVTKADIYLTLTRDHVDFGIKNNQQLLKGGLHDAIDTDSSTWTIEGQR